MIPNRAIGALITTVLALVLLLSFKTPDAPTVTGSTTAGVAEVAPLTSEVAPTTGATPTPAPTPTPATAVTSGYADGTYTGDVVSMRFGAVQVEVTIAGGTITDVTALQLPSGDHHSAGISEQAAPILREEALTAQSAEIDLLSGATYTSDAYAASLQSALDAARA
ncbi:MAG TPA: FMN-binding protein [Candidatus Limnocylindrales bacterium]